jgi:hypothetical protein
MSTTRLPTSVLKAQIVLFTPSPRKCRRLRRFSKEGRNHALISLPLFHRPNSGANLTQT